MMITYYGAFNSLGGNVAKKPDISEIVKEDVLRILCERNKKASLEFLKGEIRVAHTFLSEALEELERDELVAVQENFVLLTELGQESAKNLLKKHSVLEDYFEKTRNEMEAHTAAHILEHYVSGEVIDNIKKLSTLEKEGVPLAKFELRNEGMITDITSSDYRLFERIVSMGIVLGEKIVVVNAIPHGIIVKINGRKFALDKDIAEKIEAVEYEKL